MQKAVSLLVLSTGILSAATGYYQHNLVADTPGVADFTDPNLVNAGGIATSAASPFWTCNGGTGTSTVYAANNTPGAALGTPNAALKPTIPGAGGSSGGVCTGIVANSVTTAFNVSTAANPTPRSASFIFATEDGTISGWANAADPAKAILTVDNSTTAVYKGLAIVAAPVPQLYAANFRTGAIDVFGVDYKPVTLEAGAFTDPQVPTGLLRLISGISTGSYMSPMRSRIRIRNSMSPGQAMATSLCMIRPANFCSISFPVAL
jgi:uncharacterized protein (TIGR03118 family)